MNTVTLICGLPNSGKTTYCKKLDNVIHLDDFIINGFNLRFKNCNAFASKAETDINVDGCYYNKELRKEFLENFNGWKKVCIFINTPLEECLSRSVNGRSKDIVSLVNNVFEPPTIDEGWDKLIVLEYDKI